MARFCPGPNGLEDSPDGVLYLIERVHPRQVGFNTNPKPIVLAPPLKRIGALVTVHTTSSAFNPSVAEVLAQIPDKFLDQMTHFETIRNWPQPMVHDGLESFFVAATVLYRKL